MILSVDAAGQTMAAVDAAGQTMAANGWKCRAVIGRGGLVAAPDKREGDGATPIGQWRICGVLLRPDRVALPELRVPWRWLRPADGWSDDPADPAYNRPVSHPHRFGAERLWRDDPIYDIIVVLDHNSRPVVPGLGSAVFWHLARPDWQPTSGCVAIELTAMLTLLPKLGPQSVLRVEAPIS